MAANTKIEWCDHTFNPLSDAGWKQPLKWNRDAQCNCGAAGRGPGECDWCANGCRRPRVFCASLADVFEDWDGPIVDHKGNELFLDGDDYFAPGDDYFAMSEPATMNDLRRDLFTLIDKTPYLDWLLLTKRPENIRPMWPKLPHGEHHHRTECECKQCLYRHNVHLLTSVSEQETADRNWSHLVESGGLVPVIGMSLEPLLGPIDIWQSCRNGPAPNWCIVGGESGPGHRTMPLDALVSIHEQTLSSGVPLFVKQDSGPKPGKQGRIPDEIWRRKEFPVSNQLGVEPVQSDSCRINQLEEENEWLFWDMASDSIFQSMKEDEGDDE